MALLLKNAHVVDPSVELDGVVDVLIDGDKIAEVGENLAVEGAEVRDLSGKYLVPGLAAISTICCLLIGYPLAWAVAHSKPSTRNILLLLVILPSWTSFLIRVYAWMGILKNNGVLNNFLLWLGVIDQPLTILHTNLAVYIGIVYAYVPFMVLPIYTALDRKSVV